MIVFESEMLVFKKQKNMQKPSGFRIVQCLEIMAAKFEPRFLNNSVLFSDRYWVVLGPDLVPNWRLNVIKSFNQF